MASKSAGMTDVERYVHYSELAVQFRQWAETETNVEARAGLLDMARQYERLANELKSRTNDPPP
jgi:hypothetical protein